MAATSAPLSTATALRAGWQLASACNVTDAAALISRATYPARGWLPVSVPSTVLAAQLAAGVFRRLPSLQPAGAPFDPYFGMNLRAIPGTDYPVGTFYSNQEIPATSPYACGWWYRRSFAAPLRHGQRVYLRFVGINYRGELWVNGRRVADDREIAGAYRRYEFDVTQYVHSGPGNVVAIKVSAPGAKDLGINWVDWNPCPADKDMGLWGEVTLLTSGAVTVRSPAILSHFTDDALRSADLDVVAELHNRSDLPVSGRVAVELTGLREPVRFETPITLAAHEQREVRITANEVPALHVEQPEVWWPHGLGGQHLNHARVRFVAANDTLSDTAETRFGIREVSSELDGRGHRLFRINRHPILIRGGGWSPDMLLRESPERMEAQFRLVRALHLNTLRLEGKLETEQFFNLADEQGVLVMAGWCCCDHWEHWKDWTDHDLTIASASLRDQMLRLRAHPSLLVWLNGSDGPPPAKVENAYLGVEQETHWPNAILSSAAATPTEPTGKSGVKMLGPYDYVVPSYWLRDVDRAGGAYGFNTETSPGPAVPEISELKRFLPADKLWPMNTVWDYHTGGGKYRSLAVMNRAMDNIYGKATTLEDYTTTSAAMAYDAERAMFEAYGRNKYVSTGVVQWMLNNAWPSLIWHLYDYYLQPGAGYYGAKKANELVHVQYGYDDRAVTIVNSLFQPVADLSATARVYTPDGKLQHEAEQRVSVEQDSSTRVLLLPEGLTREHPLLFVRLELRDAGGEILSRNDYWLPSKSTEFDWPKTDYTHTEPTIFEDLTALRILPRAQVTARLLPSPSAGAPPRVQLQNTSASLAFQVQMQSRRRDGSPYDALLWDDNFVELLPGETRVFSAIYLRPGTANTLSRVQISGWNVPTTSLVVRARR